MAYRVVRAVLVGVARLWLRVTIRGAKNIPASGAFIIAPTHRSNLDFLLAAAITKRQLRFMTKDSVWRVKTLGALVNRLGGFPVNRGTPDREAMRRSLIALEQGNGLVLFPEGQRRSGPTVEALHDGVAYLAARAGVPIVPVGIAGSDAALAPGARFVKLRQRVTVEVGAPIMPQDGARGRIPRSAVRVLTADLEAELQRLYQAASA